MSNHGGKRAGAGRLRNSEKYAEPIASFHDCAAADLDKRYQALTFLADGGYSEEDVVETWEPAGLIQITKELITEDGRSVNVRELAFPHLDPEHLVCVQRVVKKRIAAPDRQANIYLVDRVAGKPTAHVEAEVDVEGLNIDQAARDAASQELAEWRRQMSEQLSSLQSAPPMPPTS